MILFPLLALVAVIVLALSLLGLKRYQRLLSIAAFDCRSNQERVRVRGCPWAWWLRQRLRRWNRKLRIRVLLGRDAARSPRLRGSRLRSGSSFWSWVSGGAVPACCPPAPPATIA